MEKVLRSLREASEIGIATISFSGGEPFVHPHFRAILREALALSLNIELVTNATLVHESDIAVLEQLKCVTVSIDGPRAQHDFIRGQAGCWDATMKTVEMLARSRATWGTNTVMQQENADVLYDTWLEIRKRGRPSYVAFTHVEVVPETSHLQMCAAQIASAASQVAQIRQDCEGEKINFNDDKLTGTFFEVFSDKTRRFRPVQGCPIPQTFLGISNYGYFPCWHQGRHIKAEGLIEALEDPICEDIIREGLERRCVGCNSANYSWSDEWVEGVLAAYEKGDSEKGVVYLTNHERQSGHIREGKRTLPILEREKRRAERV